MNKILKLEIFCDIPSLEGMEKIIADALSPYMEVYNVTILKEKWET